MSSKTYSKIKCFSLILLLSLSGFAYYSYHNSQNSYEASAVTENLVYRENIAEENINKEVEGPVVKIKDLNIPVELSITDKEIKKGLSGRVSLPEDTGMLFIFKEAKKYTFWMPDMNFNIDIIWINEGKVVDITEDLSKEFDPKNPILYKPKYPASYVLEVNTGFVKANSITVGDKVMFVNFNPKL